MNTHELIALLDRLRSEKNESEWLEFKVGRWEPQTLGEYISALANSACLTGKPRAYLIFGVEDGSHNVVGTDFDPTTEKAKGNQSLPLWLAQGLHPHTGFEIHTFKYQDKRVVLIEICPAYDRPVGFNGKAYIRIGSNKTDLRNHPEKERQIWQSHTDWSAQICERATRADLDLGAIAKARHEYKTKFPSNTVDVDGWDDTTFLNKAGLTIHGAITNAALLLLGLPESSTLLIPAVARVSWFLKNDRNEEQDYAHFDPPFLLNVDKVLARIRNLTLRELPNGTLFPVEMLQYDPWVIREALHNCIAHQDYALRGRINVVETPDSLILSSMGGFLPGSVETVIRQNAPLEIYRNPFLGKAMVSLNMIDTQGGGIKRMFQIQRRRSFPLPDFDLSPTRVVVEIPGRILDERYTHLLMKNTDLDLMTIMLLDKVQKRRSISQREHRELKSKKLVEGRYPNLIVAAKIAVVTGEKAKYIRNRGFDSKYYSDLILAVIRECQPVSREDIDKLLLNKLPEAMTPQQKINKIHNLLASLSGKTIRNIGSRRIPKWVPIDGDKQ
ncbi:MAG: putative DNA binding domain-containing protein [Nitrospinae bacterium]|nr:putative DNA binding domain-containing protein [Nitrospinota bacterium]